MKKKIEKALLSLKNKKYRHLLLQPFWKKNLINMVKQKHIGLMEKIFMLIIKDGKMEKDFSRSK